MKEATRGFNEIEKSNGFSGNWSRMQRTRFESLTIEKTGFTAIFFEDTLPNQSDPCREKLICQFPLEDKDGLAKLTPGKLVEIDVFFAPPVANYFHPTLCRTVK